MILEKDILFFLNYYTYNMITSSLQGLQFTRKLSVFFGLKMFVFVYRKGHLSFVKSPHVFSRSKEKLRLYKYMINLNAGNLVLIRYIHKNLPIRLEYVLKKNSLSFIC